MNWNGKLVRGSVERGDMPLVSEKSPEWGTSGTYRALTVAYRRGCKLHVHLEKPPSKV